MSAREPWAGVAIRAAIATDAAAIRTFLAAMDRDGLYERHFAHGEAPNLALIARLARLDGRQRTMFLAVGADGTVIGHAEYVAEWRSSRIRLDAAAGLPWRRDRPAVARNLAVGCRQRRLANHVRHHPGDQHACHPVGTQTGIPRSVRRGADDRDSLASIAA
jgi:hypothetical protein